MGFRRWAEWGSPNYRCQTKSSWIQYKVNILWILQVCGSINKAIQCGYTSKTGNNVTCSVQSKLYNPGHTMRL